MFKTNKIIIFDLDDTIGHFEQLAIFIYGLQSIIDKKLDVHYIHKLLDLWGRFLRPGIFDILELIKKKKKRDSSIKVIIYTNNNGPRSWTLSIKSYLERKINYHIFDRVITSYSPNKKGNCRTTYNKTLDDIIRCTGYSKNDKFLFLDDQNHPNMIHPKIKYVRLIPYRYNIPFEKMVDSYLDSPNCNLIRKKYINKFQAFMHSYLNSAEIRNSYNIDKTKISKVDIEQQRMIKKQIKKFLNIRKTKNNKKKSNKNKTKKNNN